MNLQESIRSDLNKLDEELIPTRIVSKYGNMWMNIYSALINFENDLNQIKQMDAAYIEKEFTPEEKRIIKQILQYGEQSTKLAQEFMKAKQKVKAVK